MELRLVAVRPLEAELAEVTREPLPTWLLRYYEMHSFAFADRPTADRMPLSARVAAVKLSVNHRLQLAADVIRRLEALGWTARVEGGRVVMAVDGDEQAGWDRLRRAGVADQILLLLDPADHPRSLGRAGSPAPSPPAPNPA